MDFASEKVRVRKKRDSIAEQNSNSYLDDVLIEEDVKNVNMLYSDEVPKEPNLLQIYANSNETNTVVHRTERDEGDSIEDKGSQYQQHFTPRQRIQIKKDLNDHYRASYNQIEHKDYDKIIRKSGISYKPKKRGPGGNKLLRKGTEVNVRNSIRVEDGGDTPSEIKVSQKESGEAKVPAKNGSKIYEQTSFNFNKFSGW